MYTTQYHTIQYHTIPYNTISYHIITHHTTPYYTIPYHTISCRTVPYPTIPLHAIPYYTIPYHNISYHAIPYQITPYQITPHHTIPYHTIQNHNITYRSLFQPHHVIQWTVAVVPCAKWGTTLALVNVISCVPLMLIQSAAVMAKRTATNVNSDLLHVSRVTPTWNKHLGDNVSWKRCQFIEYFVYSVPIKISMRLCSCLEVFHPTPPTHPFPPSFPHTCDMHNSDHLTPATRSASES
jgi:hypothetical protein